MPDFVNPTTLALVPSANDMPSPWVVIARTDFLVAAAIPQHYRKWVVDHVEEKSAGEKVAADALIEQARQTGELARYDRKDILRATILALIDELNTTRQWIASFKTEVAASTNLANLQSRVAALPSMPDRTAAQARTAIVNKLAAL